jgi:hypothetical protein
VPTLTCGLVRSNFSLAMVSFLSSLANPFPGYRAATAMPLLFVTMVSAMLFGTWA